MNVTSETSTSNFAAIRQTSARGREGNDAADRAASPLERIALVAILALSAVMNVYALSQNGYANNFYSAGVKSMLLSLHNFLFVASDPTGLITIDKPPLALWLQVVSAKLFGFAPLSLLLPEAIAGVLSVLVLYLALAKRIGRPGALMAALSLAVFPSFVAVSRDNNPDALLILLLSLACWLALLAIESGQLRTLLACAFVVGLAFNTKTLEAYLAVPGIALAYLLCAPEPLLRRVGKLLLAGVLLTVVSLVWLVFVDATPASHRPWVGSTYDNSEISLAFEYNGLGRLDGQSGGPESIPEKPGAYVPLEAHSPESVSTKATSNETSTTGKESTVASGESNLGPSSSTQAQATRRAASGSFLASAPISEAPATSSFAHAASEVPAPEKSAILPDGRARKPTPFARAPGPLRLFEGGLGTQAGWLVPLSLLGTLMLALLLLRSRREREPSQLEPGATKGTRRDPRFAALLVFGGWFLVEVLFLTVAKGIVHPYYTSEMAPGSAAMIGAGLVAGASLIGRERRWVLLLAFGVLSTAIAQVAIFENNNYMEWFGPVLVVAAIVTLLLVLVQHARMPTIWLTLCVLLIAPAVYAAATWTAPVEGTFPVAGPRGAAGFGGVDENAEDVQDDKHLLRYLSHHEVGSRFSVLTVSSVVSSPLILMGSKAASLAGYSGVDPAVSAKRLAAMVKNGEARYVLLGGPYSNRGGNSATKAVIKACRMVPPSESGMPRISSYSFTLMDCAGRASALAAS